MREPALIQMVGDVQLVVKRRKQAGYGSISAALSQAVHGGVQTADACTCGGKGICDSKSVVVVGVEVETQFRITAAHQRTQLLRLPRVEHAQGVGEHEPADRKLPKRIQHSKHVLRRIYDSVRPVLKVQVGTQSLVQCQLKHFFNISNMLLHRLPQLLAEVAA